MHQAPCSWKCTSTELGISAPRHCQCQSFTGGTTSILTKQTRYTLWGCRGSVVACVACKQEIIGSIPGWAELCSDVVLLGKALCPHMHSLDPEVSGYLVGQWSLVCLNSSVRQKWEPGCMLPGELRWPVNEQVYDQGVIVWSQVSSA